ncbi:MAG: hypothetical protein KJ970_00010 [Candidatus Eisenbacteria bacterium]|uniref:CBM11 domain-containing protein n=1 Tax=Eiseniibacteriota bacterium TaxID=2212470 RepID=A0A948RVZ8_UNCEI|nr:hypothetical protein [Candidatus Eisenbacteria bacterium]MBU2689284.1 hypothetical protein [Candidatus Eisenbacteria bacterium]
MHFLTRSLAFLALLLTVILPAADPALAQSAGKPELFDVWSEAVASGWMGDGEFGEKHVRLFEAWKEAPHSDSICIKVTYEPGPKKWAGIYWQNEPDNWGDEPGWDLAAAGYTRITFWAKGENGGEVVEFKAGGIAAPGKKHKDSFEVTARPRKIMLTNEWKQHTISLDQQNLSSVIGVFCWVANATSNPAGITFYLDDISYERETQESEDSP